MRIKGKKVSFKVDNKMRWMSDYNEDTGLIRVNKKKSTKKGEIIDDLKHELNHAKFPRKSEKAIREMTLKQKLSLKSKKKLYNLV